MESFWRDPRFPYRCMIAVLSGGLLALLAVLTPILVEEVQSYHAFTEREQIYRQQLEQLRADEAHQTAQLNEIMQNPAYREHLVRERLNYAREGEVVIRFEP